MSKGLQARYALQIPVSGDDGRNRGGKEYPR